MPNIFRPPLEPNAIAKFVAIVVQMDATEDGVILAAALAAKRLLQKHGMAWRDIAPAILSSEPPITRTHPQHWRDTVAACLSNTTRLNAWEIGFLRGVGGFATLSKKQTAHLDEIARKCGVAS